MPHGLPLTAADDNSRPIKGERMPRELVLSISVNLLMAGLDTVASMLGFVVRHLAGDDGLRRELVAHPERIG